MKKIYILTLCIIVSLQGFGQTPPTNPTARILDKGTTLIVPFQIGWEWSYDLPYVGLGIWAGTGRGFDIGLQTAISFDLDLDYLEFIPTFYLRKSIIEKEKFKFAIAGLVGFSWYTDVGFDESDQNPIFWNIPLFYSYHHKYFTVYLNQVYYNGGSCFGLKNTIGIMFGKETMFFVDYSFGMVNCAYGPSSIPSLRFAIGI